MFGKTRFLFQLFEKILMASSQAPSTEIVERPDRRWRVLWLAAALALFALLAFYQLGLPGLHYDEAKEAGVNAMELLTGAPVSAFRGASVHLFGRDLPLMVQDYIGALNVYLALPFLGLTGIGVPNLRLLSILTGLAALLGLERALSAWVAMHRPELPARSTPISMAGLIGVTLLAASPSFVFWSRQGIFVTNLTQPLVFLSIWQGLAWPPRAFSPISPRPIASPWCRTRSAPVSTTTGIYRATSSRSTSGVS
jgi:hypothetical protein